MENIKGIIFDMDGVLIDTEKISFECWVKAFKKYGYNYNMDVHTSIIGRNNESIRNVLGQTYGIEFPLDDIYECRTKYMNEYLELNGTPSKLGVHELLRFLKENEYKIALATSTNRKRAIKRLESAGIENVFDGIICGDEVENSKPNPEIFLKAAKKLGLRPEECMVVEDSPAGIEAGYNGGMTVIHVPDMIEPSEEMKMKSSYIFENLFMVKQYLEEYKQNAYTV
ncbi:MULTISPECIES: HAD family hydrolase [unclassified Romboutsia]|uniref:HAD family hydrolase n=1 Tax=unclassified Romboutsia TaxID=2626894 RepID=UPI000820F6F6|nr:MULTISPECIES: HAD family phosphatase [unclassified Romboutsia]SCI15921.1 Phosphorylated carbohydrates phosphatase TM_1254 [uncultured Clostridium sp.]